MLAKFDEYQPTVNWRVHMLAENESETCKHTVLECCYEARLPAAFGNVHTSVFVVAIAEPWELTTYRVLIGLIDQ